MKYRIMIAKWAFRAAVAATLAYLIRPFIPTVPPKEDA